MEESIYQILQTSPLFEGFSTREIEEMLSSTEYRIVEYPAKEIYTLAGLPCRYADFILRGELISRMTGLSGKQVQIDRLKACMLIAPAYAEASTVIASPQNGQNKMFSSPRSCVCCRFLRYARRWLIFSSRPLKSSKVASSN